MKAFLMFRDLDFPRVKLPPNADDLIKDLELKTLFDTMSQGDEFLFDVVSKVILSSLSDPEAIVYRQQILIDCLENPDIIRELYDITVEAIEREKNVRRAFLFESPDLVVSTTVDVLEMFIGILRRLRHISEKHGRQFQSEGFGRFFAMLKQELGDEYFRSVQSHLKKLRLQNQNGALISAELGKGNKSTNYVLREPLKDGRNLITRTFSKNRTEYSFKISDNNSTKLEELDELWNKGINLVANALVKSTEHILSFFTMLQMELGFYVGCLNLHEQLAKKKEPTCIPRALTSDNLAFSSRGLYDVCLTLKMETRVVGNKLVADKKKVLIITGANQGGKSTFLRSVGLAYLMMQCGMFVAAESFSANICTGVFTHFKRKEDSLIKSGKLDEELNRMSEIADHIKPGCILLCNEAFASMNEREGSEIALQVTLAFLESGIRVLLVTHLFELTKGLYNKKMDTALFLRAERRNDGQRTFRIGEGEPLSTSYGKDLYRQIFEEAVQESAVIAAKTQQ
jgi:DNA mismatch repair ATPase MutS